MRVALFGGTGFVGGYLVDALIAAAHEPVVLVRAGSENKIRQAACCTLLAGDIGSAAAIKSTLQSCDAAIYNVGILREFPRRGITFSALQLDGLVRVADAATQLGVRRLILMSANGVKAVGTPYQETKFRAEQYALKCGLEATIFRPSVIFGDPRGTMEIASQLHRDMIAPPFPALAFHSGLIPGAGQIMMSPVHVTDVADAFVHALTDTNTFGKAITLGGPEELSWTEMLRRIAIAVGKDRKLILPMPVGFMRIGATLLDWLPFIPVTRDQLIMLAEGNVAAPADLQALTGRSAKAFTPENLSYLVN